MKFTNVRLVGFKSFVEPTDFEIRDGLTGIVGPNGCGKSNLLEALRWVMGATSAKALRGDGMDAVIFSGTSMRPARNWAEVILTLDNSDRTAPAEYNESATLEISRRILRKEDGTQSIYRINNKEVRAKDVQLLFADASTGANSPALVRQGQVAELISAKPQNRRRLLEEAAGVTGLHSRRHEAELRLRAAEQNLERLDDVIGELESQKTALARQARQATRYRNISGDIRRAEAMHAYLRWRDARDAQDHAATALREISAELEASAREAAGATARQTQAHEALEPLRQSEAQAGAALHRLTIARENLDDEARRARDELARLASEIERLKNDITRENELLSDAQEAAHTLDREEEGLKSREANEAGQLQAAETEMKIAADALEKAEREFAQRSGAAAEFEGKRRTISENIANAERRLEKITAKIAAFREERDLIAPTPEQARALEEANARFKSCEAAAQEAELQFQGAEEERVQAEERESSLRGPLRQAERALSEIAAERDALRRLLAMAETRDFEPLIERLDVDPGYENALAAALGDDVNAATDEGAPAHWSQMGETPSDSNLPANARPLTEFVRAPRALARRLAMIGVVEKSDGDAMRHELKPGQRLVSRDGDLWRWDGFVALAEAKTAAAVRLEQRNRLQVLEAGIATAQSRAQDSRREHERAAEFLKERQARERSARQAYSDARRQVDSARNAASEREREYERLSARIVSIDEHLSRLLEDETETTRTRESLFTEKSELPDSDALSQGVAQARDLASRMRAKASEARAAFNDLSREAQMRAQRLLELSRERGVWKSRAETAKSRIAELEERLKNTIAAHDAAGAAPARIEEKRMALIDQITIAEERRNDAGDALARAQTHAQQCDKQAKEAEGAAAQIRETRARLEAQDEAANERVEEAVSLAREQCEAAPEELLAIAGHKEGKDLPEREYTERRLERYKRERENLGGVNLRADEELKEISERLTNLAIEREDCEGAVRKLRAAISSLNREARQRLLDAFDSVNQNFSDLFKRLFNGGQAELKLIDSEDPLEAGLEIFASPPGKKLASMSLLSGGEQALTATALIFAVFMANPAPVCFLDEVDAPLDDTNVERFCRLLREMTNETDTRFITITHHALTMSRMDRLFGVTMIERGVSQLVSVDLSKAEQLAAAE